MVLFLNSIAWTVAWQAEIRLNEVLITWLSFEQSENSFLPFPLPCHLEVYLPCYL